MKSYIQSMRKFVGHQCILQVGASIIVINKENQVLLQKRTDNQCWGYHGGSVDLDEVVEEAAKRELFEETGLIADSLELFGVFSGKELHHIYPNQDEVSNIDIVYLCKEYNGETIRQEDEVSELKWFDINQLPDNINPPNIPALKKLVEELQKFVSRET